MCDHSNVASKTQCCFKPRGAHGWTFLISLRESTRANRRPPKHGTLDLRVSKTSAGRVHICNQLSVLFKDLSGFCALWLERMVRVGGASRCWVPGCPVSCCLHTRTQTVCLLPGPALPHGHEHDRRVMRRRNSKCRRGYAEEVWAWWILDQAGYPLLAVLMSTNKGAYVTHKFKNWKSRL